MASKMNNKKIKIISLGPTCIAASLIKCMGLKRESYPLDWAQSGSEIVKELFELPSEGFYWRHVHSSTHLMRQIDDTRDLSEGELPTHHLEPMKSLFGYPWFYNPHSTKNSHGNAYYIRCIKRFKEIIDDSESELVGVLADQPDTKGSSFLNVSEEELVNFFGYLNSLCSCKLKIVIARICVSKNIVGEIIPIDLYHKNVWKLNIRIPEPFYNGSPESDRNYELLMASAFLKRFLNKEIFEK